MFGTRKSLTRNFLRDESGNFALITALSLSVLLGSVGMAIDLAGANKHKMELQAQVDAAVLAAAAGAAMSQRDGAAASDKKANKNKQIKKRVKEFVKEDDRFATAKVKVKVNKKEIQATAESRYETMLMGVFGRKYMDTKVIATAPRATLPPLDLVLVLDTTNSMTGDNMMALKEAALDLIDTVEDSNMRARVSLVPYGEYVNIGVSREGESWLSVDRPDYTIAPTTETRPVMNTIVPEVCFGTGEMVTEPVYNDGIWVRDKVYERRECTPGEYEAVGTENVDWPAVDMTYEWEGCAGSRAAPSNLVPAASSADPVIAATQQYRNGVKNGHVVACGQEMIPLTDDWEALRTAINDMSTSGFTYLPSGLMWGWRAMDPALPFDEAASRPDAMRSIIFMTDGANMRSQNGEYHNGGNAEAGNTHAMALCDGIKNSGITINTVAYDLPPFSNPLTDPQTFMQNCASGPGNAYTADNVFELKDSFNSILMSMMDVRLSR